MKINVSNFIFYYTLIHQLTKNDKPILILFCCTLLQTTAKTTTKNNNEESPQTPLRAVKSNKNIKRLKFF